MTKGAAFSNRFTKNAWGLSLNTNGFPQSLNRHSL